LGYKVLYRQWRPQDFQSLVGQDHISKTLQNAIKTGRIAHAYLFTGPRGTGKTSTAKILAKVVNCEAPKDGQPCNVCQNCENITNGLSLDVMEMDAASNRGIDEIRDIRERISYVPSQGKYKVYIIDEVHMLTTEAFNALLKTLEEPPAHVIFILATTEPHKIPATILSRCQRFDFRRIPPAQIEERLTKILNALQVTADEGALDLIVKKAEGGLRDAISILDQCLSFSQEHVSLQTAYDVLGIVKSDALLSLTDALINEDAAKVLTVINTMLREGIEPAQVIKDLLEHLRNMVLLLVCGGDSPLVLVPDNEKGIFLEQGQRLGLDWLSKTIAILARVDSESRWRQNMRIVLETTLIGLILREGKTSDEIPAKSQTAKKVADNNKAVEKTTAKAAKTDLNTEHKAVDITAENTDAKTAETDKFKTATHPVAIFSKVQEKWPQVMEMVREQKKTVHAYLTECEPCEFTDKKLVLLFKSGYTFHKEKIEATENRKMIEGILEKLCGEKIQYICVLEEEDKRSEPHDPVKKALNLFGPGVVIVKD